MTRTVSLLAGSLAVAAITYKFRDDLMVNTNDIRRRLGEAKSTLEHVAAGTASQSHPRSQPVPSRSFIGESQHYVSNRLIPEVKNSWNDHISGAAKTIIRTDVSSYTKKLWDDNVAPNFKKD
ncbi:hypothetical protein BDA99DRAFT_544108 [Phascolomyces articulosus]|uniref:Uncharacterized protein n=1 Tax=Phascolomyces articulosus TaxID=60185 RepID=A0AAD5P744_9FUNG|nr:hypothetical protein BDA99DRAFT_544108 [Phascolomyces articulosus]